MRRQKIPYVYAKLLSSVQEKADQRHRTVKRTDLERQMSSDFRLNKFDLKNICKELEDYGFLKRVNKNKLEVKWWL